MPDLIDLAGKSVIVTGASSGIGASTARLLHAAGAHPVLAARRADRLAALSEELAVALAVPTDVTDPAQVAHSPDYVADVVLRLLRTGEDSFDIPHGPEQPDLARVPG